MAKIEVDEAEYRWLEWFYVNADFGPGDCDVRYYLRECYESQGGVYPYEDEDEE